MSWLKSLLYTWFKVFGVSSPEDIAAERARRNSEWRIQQTAKSERKSG